MKLKIEFFDLSEVGSMIYVKRNEAKMTQAHLAKIVGCHKNIISQMENGNFKRVNLHRMIELFRVLKIKIKIAAIQ